MFFICGVCGVNVVFCILYLECVVLLLSVLKWAGCVCDLCGLCLCGICVVSVVFVCCVWIYTCSIQCMHGVYAGPFSVSLWCMCRVCLVYIVYVDYI